VSPRPKYLQNRWLIVWFVGFVVLVSLVGSLIGGCHSSWWFEASTLVILAVTLIFIVRYWVDTNRIAIDTNRIAQVTEKKWEAEITPKLTRDLAMIDIESQDPRTAFALTNHTDYFIEATVNCNFKVYGESVEWPSAYDGSEIWDCLPYRTAQGIFKINEILSKKGKTIAQMVSERDEVNKMTQLTMFEEIAFKNELGRSRKIPPRKWYFDFERWRWIPFLTRPK
jgi:hypothetical protein